MKKVLSVSLLALGIASAPSADAGKWYMGAGLGWLKTSQDAKIGNNNDGAVPAQLSYKKEGISDKAATGLLFVGHSFDNCWGSFFFDAGLGGDKASMSTSFDNPAVAGKVDLTFKRLGTLTFNAGVKKSFKQLDVSLKMGLLLSKFQTEFGHVQSNWSSTKTQYTWGFAPGIDVSRKMGPVTVGLGYSYQVYDVVKMKAYNLPQGHSFSINTKPRYHTVMLTVSKSFG